MTALTALLATTDDGSRNPGPLPLLLVVVLGLVTFLLIKNMSGRIKRLPREFPDQSQERDESSPSG